MKKFLRLSLVALLTLVANVAMADTVVTLKASETNLKGQVSAAGEMSVEKDGIKMTTSNGMFYRDDHYRAYKSSQLTIASTVGNITKVEFTCTATDKNNYGPGNFTTEDEGYTYSGNAGTWTGNTATLVLTATNGQVRMTEVVVTIGGSATPTVAAPQISGTTPFYPSTTATITAATGATIYYTVDGSNPTTTSAVYSAPIAINAATTVKAIAVKDGQTSSVAEKAFAPVGTVASDIDDFKSLEKGTVAVLTLTNAQVLFADATNRSVYVRDNTGATCFYNLALGLTTGDILNGTVVGKADNYNGLPEVTKADATSADNFTITAGNAPEPIALAIDEAQNNKYLCQLITIQNVKLDSIGKNLYASVGTDSVQVYDQLRVLNGIALPTSSTGNSVTGILVPYKNSFELYPTTAEGIITATRLNALKAEDDDQNAPTFNLAGQRVDASYKGVVIRQGKKMVQR